VGQDTHLQTNQTIKIKEIQSVETEDTAVCCDPNYHVCAYQSLNILYCYCRVSCYATYNKTPFYISVNNIAYLSLRPRPVGGGCLCKYALRHS
jgi:hypothetical protein